MLFFKTPKEWLKLWSGPRDPNKYLHLVLEKTTNLSKFKNDVFAKPIRLGNFLNPDGFLVAYKQEFSRY